MLLPILMLASLMASQPPDTPVHDVVAPLTPAPVELRGYLGRRVNANVQRLLDVDLEPLLAGFRHRPGSHPWIGEHIGKWMHAASLAYEYEADADVKARLRKKLDYAATELTRTQEPDGYLGTYPPDKRFGLYQDADWDVWVHKYCLIGLLAYHGATGDPAALAAARRAADLLIDTFGPGKRSIVTAGTHRGMAATSVLEPIVLLYRATGDERYLDFARHIVRAYDDPGGPRLLDSLLTTGSVAATANGKAYEMLSNIVGVCELYRATGETRLLDAAKHAFDDVVANQLYITGAASHYEHFYPGHDLPNVPSANVGETCVTVTWMQLCEQLFRLTGDAKYADEIERSAYNHLAAAQRPDGSAWCYYTALEGVKPYTSETCCCLSSGPRGMAMIPRLVFVTVHGKDADELGVNLFEPASAAVTLGGLPVDVRLETGFPGAAGATLRFTAGSGSEKSVRCGLRVRTPRWAAPVSVEGAASAKEEAGWLVIPEQDWRIGEPIRIGFSLRSSIIRGEFGNAGKDAATFGPFVLAYDEARNAGGPPARLVWFNAPVSRGVQSLEFATSAVAAPDGRTFEASLIPFAEAGTDGSSKYRVWLGARGTFDPSRLTWRDLATESRSREGNVEGSIIDGDPKSFVVTFDGTTHDVDWFGVEFASPVEFRRVEFMHGHTFHDGGWFDASAGPPRIEIRRSPGAAWEPIGRVDGYPPTTGAAAAGLKGRERFECRLDAPVRAVAVRVIGTPAHGDNPAQSFASCAELAVSAE